MLRSTSKTLQRKPSATAASSFGLVNDDSSFFGLQSAIKNTPQKQNHQHHHVVFDLSKNKSWILPSNKALKKAAASYKCHIQQSQIHDNTKSCADSSLLVSALSKLGLKQQSHNPSGILRVTKNPHFDQELKNISLDQTLFLRPSEFAARKQEGLVEEPESSFAVSSSSNISKDNCKVSVADYYSASLQSKAIEDDGVLCEEMRKKRSRKKHSKK